LQESTQISESELSDDEEGKEPNSGAAAWSSGLAHVSFVLEDCGSNPGASTQEEQITFFLISIFRSTFIRSYFYSESCMVYPATSEQDRSTLQGDTKSGVFVVVDSTLNMNKEQRHLTSLISQSNTVRTCNTAVNVNKDLRVKN
jgi:hypothetical protein